MEGNNSTKDYAKKNNLKKKLKGVIPEKKKKNLSFWEKKLAYNI